MDPVKKELLKSVLTLIKLEWHHILSQCAREITGSDLADERGVVIRLSLGREENGTYTNGLMARLQDDLEKRGRIRGETVRLSIEENITKDIVPNDKMREQLKVDLQAAYAKLQQSYFRDEQRGARS